MRITVLGAGNIGATLGRAWLAAGHEVTFGVRNVDGYDELRQAGGALAPVTEAVAGADVVVLALPGNVTAATVAGLGDALDGAIVIDATNNMAGGQPVNARAAVAAAAPGAQYYRAFSTLGWESFAQPVFAGGERADLFYAGPGGESQQRVERLVTDVGLRPVWVGGDEQVDIIDGLARLWFALALGAGHGRHTALRMLTDPT